MGENRAFKFYARILRLYPRSFQVRFKTAMLQTFKDHYRYTAGYKKIGTIFWLETIGDETMSIIKEYLTIPTIRLLIGGIIFWAVYLLPHTPILNINTVPSLLFLFCTVGVLYSWWAMSLSKLPSARVLLTITAALGCYLVVQLASLEWFGFEHRNAFGEVSVIFYPDASDIVIVLCFIIPGLLLEMLRKVIKGRSAASSVNSVKSDKDVVSN